MRFRYLGMRVPVVCSMQFNKRDKIQATHPAPRFFSRFPTELSVFNETGKDLLFTNMRTGMRTSGTTFYTGGCIGALSTD